MKLLGGAVAVVLICVMASRPASGWFVNLPSNRRCWTDWFDRDDPSGSGDWERLADLRKENPGKICPRPVDIEVRTLSGQTPGAAGDIHTIRNPSYGFVCKNYLQPDKKCNDYHVRFSCHPPYCGEGVCWTPWFDRDNPGGHGDNEMLKFLRIENPGKICKTPCYMEAVTRDTHTPAYMTGQVFRLYNPTDGFLCVNRDQKLRKYCRDYKVRFGCRCKE